jgi:hypothetical protein
MLLLLLPWADLAMLSNGSGLCVVKEFSTQLYFDIFIGVNPYCPKRMWQSFAIALIKYTIVRSSILITRVSTNANIA